MKKLIFAFAVTALFASCSKEDNVSPNTNRSNTTKSDNPEVVSQNRLIPPWDVVNATYSQYTRPRNGYSASVTFGTTQSGTTGTGDIYVAACNSAGQITSGWSGLYSASNYVANFNPSLMRVTGSKVAILFYPYTGGTPIPPASQIGYTVNSIANDGMDLATVQTF